MRLIRYLIVGVLSVPLYAVESGPGGSLDGEEIVEAVSPEDNTEWKSPEERPSGTDLEKAKKREKKRAYFSEYYNKNKDKYVDYYNKNKSEITAYKKAYDQRNKDKIIAYLEENKQRIAERNKEYYQNKKSAIYAQKKKYYQRKQEERLAARSRAAEQDAVQDIQGAGGPEELAALEVVRKQVHREEDPSDGVGGIEQEGNVIPGVIPEEAVPLATEERKDQGWEFPADVKEDDVELFPYLFGQQGPEEGDGQVLFEEDGEK